MQVAHIIPRSHFNTRWDLDNLITLCWNCHFNWAHKNPLEFAEFVKEKLGEKKYNDLKIRGQMSARGQDLEMIRLYLESLKRKST